MSKITNDGLTRSDTGCFTDRNSGRQRVKDHGNNCKQERLCQPMGWKLATGKEGGGCYSSEGTQHLNPPLTHDKLSLSLAVVTLVSSCIIPRNQQQQTWAHMGWA